MKTKSKLRKLLAAVAAFLLLAAAYGPAKGQGEPGSNQQNERPSRPAKYVFLFIGDGMGLAQLNSAEIYANAMGGRDITIKKLAMTQLPAQGLTTTYDAGTFITDSASAATAIATGHKTLSGVVNMDPGKKVKYTTIAELAKKQGMKVGVITSVSLDHATPACFYAKAPSRNEYYNIAVQMAQSDFDFFGGGGLLQPRGKNNNQADVIEMAKANGFRYVNTKQDFEALKPGGGKVIAVSPALYDASAMKYDMDRDSGELSLADFTRKATELLNNEKGFFVMVEGGKIDWACHANDAAASINDVLALDRAVIEALRFYEQHPSDTLIVVTGDHETGGMTIGFAGTRYDTFFDKVSLQKGSFVKFDTEVLKPYKTSTPKEKARIEDLMGRLEEYFGLKSADLTDFERQQIRHAFARSMGNEIERASDQETYLLYGGYEPLTVTLTHLLNQKAGIGWTTYSHTGTPVATFAKGAGQGLFDGYYDNTDIFKKLAVAMNLTVTVSMAK